MVDKKAAQLGHAEAQYTLGGMHDVGFGVETDYREAVKWYMKAAQLGHTHAQYDLGAMYAKGLGVETDYVTAHKWWNIAAAQGRRGCPQIA